MKIHSKTASVVVAAAALAALGFAASRATVRRARRLSAPSGRSVEVDGVRLHVQQQGSGPDVLLIHGAAMNGTEMMLALSGALAGQRITAIDRPGHGLSAKARRPSVKDQAALLRAAAIELGLERPVIVGHSLGGAVALAYGDAFPEEIAGVVCVAPLAFPGWGPAHFGRIVRGAPLLGPALSNTVLALGDPLVLRAAMRLVFSPQKPTAAFRRTINVDQLAQPSAMVADGADFVRASVDLEPLSRRYARFPVPLHVIVGDKDRILKPQRQGRRLARLAPRAILTRLPELGHMLHHFAPEVVAGAVEEVRSWSMGAVSPVDEPPLR